MNDQRALESALRSWLGEDSREAVDGVLESVLGRLDAHPQRRRRSLIPGWLAGRPSGARALVVAVGLLVLALLAISLLPVAVPQPVSQTDAPSTAPSIEAPTSAAPSDVPSQSLAPSIEPTLEPSLPPSPTSTMPATPEPTFDWSQTSYSVWRSPNVWPGEPAWVDIHDVPQGAECSITVVYDNGSVADVGPVSHPEPGRWRWEWIVPIALRFEAQVLAQVDTTCTYQGRTVTSERGISIEPLWGISGEVGTIVPNEIFSFSGFFYVHPDDAPRDINCTFTLTWADGAEQSVNEPHVSTQYFPMILEIGPDPLVGTHAWETVCFDAEGTSHRMYGTVVYE